MDNGNGWSRGVSVLLRHIRAPREAIPDQELELLLILLKYADGSQLDETANRLSKRLTELRASLSPEEVRHLDQLMSVVSSNIIESSDNLPIGSPANPFLRITQQYFLQERGRPFFWSGRPSWMTEHKLAQLRSEAECQRSLAVRRNRAYVAAPGPICRSLVSEPLLKELVPPGIGSIKSSGFGTIVYYEKAGDGVSPHADVGEFHWNLLVCIEAKGGESAIRFHLGREAELIRLKPGDALLFEAGRIIHDRPPIRPGERISIAVFGLNQSGKACDGSASNVSATD